MLRVTHGWVGFERDGREAYIPQGAVAPTRAGSGTRHAALRGRAGRIRRGADDARLAAPPSEPRRAAALDLVLANARRRDALTLWHLLTRGAPEERARVYDRLAALAPPPRRRHPRAVLAGDRRALDRWWDRLGIDTSSWWRLSRRSGNVAFRTDTDAQPPQARSSPSAPPPAAPTAGRKGGRLHLSLRHAGPGRPGALVATATSAPDAPHVIERMREVLVAAGSSLEQVVAVTVYLTSADGFPRDERGLPGLLAEGPADQDNRGHRPWSCPSASKSR